MQVKFSAYASIPYLQNRLEFQFTQDGFGYTLSGTPKLLAVTGIIEISTTHDHTTDTIYGWVDAEQRIRPVVYKVQRKLGLRRETIQTSYAQIKQANDDLTTTRLQDMFHTIELLRETSDPEIYATHRNGRYNRCLFANAEHEHKFLAVLRSVITYPYADFARLPSRWQAMADIVAAPKFMTSPFWRHADHEWFVSLLEERFTVRQLEEQVVDFGTFEYSEVEAIATELGEGLGSWQFYQDERLYLSNVDALERHILNFGV